MSREQRRSPRAKPCAALRAANSRTAEGRETG